MTPRNPFLRRAFPLEKILGVPERFAASYMNSQSCVNPRRILLEKTQGKWTRGMRSIPARRILFGKRHRIWERSAASHINLQSHWTQDAFYLRKHKESGRFAATRVCLEKRCGILGGLAGLSCEFFIHIERKTHFTWENIRNLGVGTTRIFLEKQKALAGSVMCDIFFNQNEAQAQCIRYTQQFLQGWWQTEEGVYINKEQR